MNFEEIEKELNIKILFLNPKNFKIGKTGKSLEERYDEEYKDSYKEIEEIYCNSSKIKIDELEKHLIRNFIDNPRCDNEQIGSGEMKDTGAYSVYLVFNK